MVAGLLARTVTLNLEHTPNHCQLADEEHSAGLGMMCVGPECVTPGQSGKQPKELVTLPACSVHVTCM